MEVVVILVALLLIGAITALFFSYLNNRKIQKKIDIKQTKIMKI